MRNSALNTNEMSILTEKTGGLSPNPEGLGKLGQIPVKEYAYKRAIWDACIDCNPDGDPRLCKEKDCPLYRKWDKGKQGSKLSPLKSIHQYCVWCQGDQLLFVSKCTALHCPLFPYRSGHNPKLKGKGPRRPVWLR